MVFSKPTPSSKENEITIEKNQNRVVISGEEYAIISYPVSRKFGKGNVVKCCSLLMKDYREIYLLKYKKRIYTVIEDTATLEEIIKENSLPEKYNDVLF